MDSKPSLLQAWWGGGMMSYNKGANIDGISRDFKVDPI